MITRLQRVTRNSHTIRTLFASQNSILLVKYFHTSPTILVPRRQSHREPAKGIRAQLSNALTNNNKKFDESDFEQIWHNIVENNLFSAQLLNQLLCTLYKSKSPDRREYTDQVLERAKHVYVSNGGLVNPVHILYPLMIALLQWNMSDEIPYFIEKIKHYKSSLQPYMITRLISISIRMRKPEMALLLAQEFPDSYKNINFNYLISSYVHVKDFDNAIALSRSCIANGQNLDIPVYGLLIENLAKFKSKNIEVYRKEIMEHLVRIQNKLTLNPRFLVSLMILSSKMDTDLYAKHWLNTMQQMKIPFTQSVVNSYIHLLSRTARFSEVFDVVQNMEANYGVKPSIYSYTNLFTAALERSQVLTVLELIERDRIELTSVALRKALSKLSFLQCSSDVLSIYRSFKNSSQIDINIIYVVLRSQIDNPQALQEVYCDLQELSLKPDLKTVQLLVFVVPKFREELIEHILQEQTSLVKHLHAVYPDLYLALISKMQEEKDARRVRVERILAEWGCWSELNSFL